MKIDNNTNLIGGDLWEEDLRRAIEASKNEANSWTYVSQEPGRKKNPQTSPQVALLAKDNNKQDEDIVQKFLSNFKASPCKKKDHHDHRRCEYTTRRRISVEIHILCFISLMTKILRARWKFFIILVYT